MALFKWEPHASPRWCVALLVCCQAVFADPLINDAVNLISFDPGTGLTWQDDAKYAKESFTFEDAKKFCEAARFGGFADWRMPNIFEMVTNGDHSKSSPELRTDFMFHNLRNIHVAYARFWTFDPRLVHPRVQWNAYGATFHSEYGGQDRQWSIRCVRGAEIGLEKLVDLQAAGRVRLTKHVINELIEEPDFRMAGGSGGKGWAQFLEKYPMGYYQSYARRRIVEDRSDVPLADYVASVELDQRASVCAKSFPKFQQLWEPGYKRWRAKNEARLQAGEADLRRVLAKHDVTLDHYLAVIVNPGTEFFQSKGPLDQEEVCSGYLWLMGRDK